MTEKDLIETCKKRIEEHYHLPASQLWRQRDFQYLSDLIFEKTSVRLSLSTLKRIWKNQDERSP